MRAIRRGFNVFLGLIEECFNFLLFTMGLAIPTAALIFVIMAIGWVWEKLS